MRSFSAVTQAANINFRSFICFPGGVIGHRHVIDFPVARGLHEASTV